tara:strand:+ start:1338 stop:1487 length:150 start_codon:yes stop_codon:yes gene_type:complete
VGFWSSLSENPLKARIRELEGELNKAQSDLSRTRDVLDKVVRALVDDED